MRIEELNAIWPTLRKQVRSLKIPWIEQMTARERDPFQVLISCILSLRTQDKTTEALPGGFFGSPPRRGDGESTGGKDREGHLPRGILPRESEANPGDEREIAAKYGGRVPDTIEELLRLRGVGRKTANLVVTVGYDRDGICVDTHVHRITNRWGLIKTKNPHPDRIRAAAGASQKILEDDQRVFGRLRAGNLQADFAALLTMPGEQILQKSRVGKRR